MIWEKWISADWRARVILAFFYVYVSFAIPLNHTCHLYNHKQSNYYHNDCLNQFHEICCDAKTKPAINEIITEKTLQTNSQYCAACFYSLLSKSHGPTLKVLPVTIDVFSLIEILPQHNIKYSEHLFSISLRAPPSTIS